MSLELPRVFLARAGSDGEDEETALDQNLAILGFIEVPSLMGVRTYDDVARLVRETYPNAKPRACGNFAGQLWAFVLDMKDGDTVVLPRKSTSQIAIGRVAGPYEYRKIGNSQRHCRPVSWIRTDIPRSAIGQDLLLSFGAYMTVCQISRNEAQRRVAELTKTGVDPGYTGDANRATRAPVPATSDMPMGEAPIDLPLAAHDQIIARIQERFRDHSLAKLVDAVLQSDGWVTKLSPPGPDGGVDILAGRGQLGLDEPRLAVQVKSQNSAADVTVLRTLRGSMQTFSASQGLLVCWGGFNKVVQAEARQSHFSVRLWESRDLLDAIYRNYDKLPAEIQAELPLKRVWMLVTEGDDT